MAQKRRTQRILAEAGINPAYLSGEMLEDLVSTYPYPPRKESDPDSRERAGSSRADELLRLPGAREARSMLELGCWDGMVSSSLAGRGKSVTAIDYRDSGFDSRAARQGVRLLQMDATALAFPDGHFDFVFSYDSFEHFGSPRNVLSEALRVVRPGGHVYLDFGPLYYSPFGEHAYRSVPVPYCQFLFMTKDIDAFTERHGLPAIDYGHVNRFSLEQYRTLWDEFSPYLDRVRYLESMELRHLDLIRRFPTCFASKSRYIDNFVVDNIKVLFRKFNP